MLNLNNSIIPVDAVFRKTVLFEHLLLNVHELLFADDPPVQHDPRDGHIGNITGNSIATAGLP